MPSVPRTIFTSSRQPEHFGRHLLFGAEEVRVVLGEAADAGHAAEFAGLFPAIDGAEFGQADRQVAVAVLARWRRCGCDAGSSSA